jgi:hypothetical protein
MENVTDWIGKSLQSISQTALFNKYFSNTKLDNVEDVFFFENLSLGIDVTFDEDLMVNAIHLFSENYENARSFGDNLPNGLFFTDRKDEVKTKLGEADVYGGDHQSNLLGYIQYWEKYYYNNYSLHLYYSDNKRNILLVTVGRLDFEAGIIPN